MKSVNAIPASSTQDHGRPSDAPGTAAPLRSLADTVRLTPDKLLTPGRLTLHGGITAAPTVLVLLAAGKGTRFGQQPKCIQAVLGTPLARHSIDAFRSVSPVPVICLVGYRHDEVCAALGEDNLYVRSDNPAGGTAFAVFEAFCVPGLLEANPLVVVTMGDRIVPPEIFHRLLETHATGPREADLTILTARYEPPRHLGKGRVLRDEAGRVTRIVEEKDIADEPDAVARQALHNLTEGNCPLYVIRAASLHRHLATLTNANAQGQYYLTDIVASIKATGGEIRTVTTQPADGDYDLLCADVTRPADLALLEGVLRKQPPLALAREDVADAVRTITAHRPPAQLASVVRQLQELVATAAREKLGWLPNQPVAIGVSGGRLRIAFMHPDMGRFFGPAWQMPIGAGSADGGEQIVVLAQPADDRRIHLFPLDAKYRESINEISSDDEVMYPGAEIADWHSYEGFGTRMSETLLLSLGYFSDDEIESRHRKGLPLPPASLRVTSNMRRPFALVANAIASLRTLRDGNLGARVQRHLGRRRFGGLRLLCTGNIPQGGFSSSSAVTVATKNALNSLFDLCVPPDLLVHLACQAEYGTGVRAGSLDQATEQKGRAGEGTLISSNPADNYRIIGTYPVPTERFRVIFPYSVERDRSAWRWSWGAYAETAAAGLPLTAGETRKMTGKAAEIAAILARLPIDMDFFKCIEADLVEDGRLSRENRAWIAGVLRQMPLLISHDELQQRVNREREWYVAELRRGGLVDATAADQKADTLFAALFAGWREPVMRDGSGGTADRLPSERMDPPPPPHLATASQPVHGVPLRAMLAYLFSEVAKNFFLIHHPEQWIECVTRSQLGDRSISIDFDRLPDRTAMEGELTWEKGLAGPERLAAWLERHGAAPYEFNRELDDATLSAAEPPEFHHWPGGSFFRGLALIDLAEAMLKRAFGGNAVAVRVNAAGQGDYFQVHIDSRLADPDDVKEFLRRAYYRRFALVPEPDFVTTHPGGGAVGVRLSRYDMLPELIRRLQSSHSTAHFPAAMA